MHKQGVFSEHRKALYLQSPAVTGFSCPQPKSRLSKESCPRRKRSNQPASKCMRLKKNKNHPAQIHQFPNCCKAEQLFIEVLLEHWRAELKTGQSAQPAEKCPKASLRPHALFSQCLFSPPFPSPL